MAERDEMDSLLESVFGKGKTKKWPEKPGDRERYEKHMSEATKPAFDADKKARAESWLQAQHDWVD